MKLNDGGHVRVFLGNGKGNRPSRLWGVYHVAMFFLLKHPGVGRPHSWGKPPQWKKTSRKGQMHAHSTNAIAMRPV